MTIELNGRPSGSRNGVFGGEVNPHADHYQHPVAPDHAREYSS